MSYKNGHLTTKLTRFSRAHNIGPHQGWDKGERLLEWLTFEGELGNGIPQEAIKRRSNNNPVLEKVK